MENYTTSKSISKKKLKLFGFEINSTHKIRHEKLTSEEDGNMQMLDSSVDSKSSSSLVELAKKKKKYECQWCFKVLANSQALGGHQNAHKKERLREKWLQYQARQAAGLSHYLNNHSYSMSDHDYSTEFCLVEGSQMCFKGEDHFSEFDFEQEHTHRLFSLTNSEGSPSSSYDCSNYKVCGAKPGNLELHLGLGVDYDVPPF